MRVAVDHVGLSVADLDAAEGFYSTAFGFTRQLEFELSPHPIRGLMLTHPSGSRLELFEHAESAPGLQAAGPIEAHATRGYNHFALAASDIDELFAAALTAGASPVIGPRPSPEPGVRFAFLADPEGNLVELVEIGE
jgi:catechol 2,3-dioxygenase-like lactoylglutathione lyase family enzyme